MKKYWIIGSLVIVAIVATSAMIFTGNKAPELKIRTAGVENGSLIMTVKATGYIQPVLKVAVGTQVSGMVERLYADFNSLVVKGQLLAQLDKSTLKEKVAQCEAQCADASSNYHLAKLHYDRTKILFNNNAATQTALEEAENRLNTSTNAIKNAGANLKQAKVNLSYADIYSPISGRILSRDVDEGQTVAASFNTPTLFTIANDLKKMQVEADIDEADIGQIKIGQVVEFNVDTYPGEKFKGEVAQIRLNPTVVSNVVTYKVIIEAPNPDERLLPGMTANVVVSTESSNGLLIPTEALYYKPDTELLGDYEIVGARNETLEQVFVINGNRLECRAVRVGAGDGVKSMILEGLSNKDQVLLSVHKVVEKKKKVNITPTPPTH